MKQTFHAKAAQNPAKSLQNVRKKTSTTLRNAAEMEALTTQLFTKEELAETYNYFDEQSPAVPQAHPTTTD